MQFASKSACDFAIKSSVGASFNATNQA